MATDSAKQFGAPTMASRRPSWVVFARTTRAATKSAVLWGYVFGVFIASSAWSYSSIYKTQAQRDSLAATFGNNKATIALFGPAPDLQTVGGFTAFKVSMTLMMLGADLGSADQLTPTPRRGGRGSVGYLALGQDHARRGSTGGP